MSAVDVLLDDLVAANRILASEGVCDTFGHVSARHPDHPDRYFLSRARAPDLIERGDIMEFTLDGTPVDAADTRQPYLERFIHGGLYERRPDVNSVVHSHSRSVLPFSVTGVPLRPLLHNSATMGSTVPVWDTQTRFGDTGLLVADVEMGRDFAATLGEGRSALMRGHGSSVVGRSIREAVYTAVYLEVNAGLQLQAASLGAITFLTEGEVRIIQDRLGKDRPGVGFDRAWEYWCRKAGVTPAKSG